MFSRTQIKCIRALWLCLQISSAEIRYDKETFAPAIHRCALMILQSTNVFLCHVCWESKAVMSFTECSVCIRLLLVRRVVSANRVTSPPRVTAGQLGDVSGWLPRVQAWAFLLMRWFIWTMSVLFWADRMLSLSCFIPFPPLFFCMRELYLADASLAWWTADWTGQTWQLQCHGKVTEWR